MAILVLVVVVVVVVTLPASRDGLDGERPTFAPICVSIFDIPSTAFPSIQFLPFVSYLYLGGGVFVCVIACLVGS